MVNLSRHDALADALATAQIFQVLQQALMKNPEAGEVIEGAGGLRKMRFADARRGKGKRGGLRVIYCWWSAGTQFWLSRALFATYLRTNVRTMENWEQGRAKPNAQAALLINLVKRFPDTVERLAAI